MLISERKTLSLKSLIMAEPDTLVEELMHTEVMSVSVLTDQEEVSNVFKRYGLLALPVVDQEGRLVGIITVDDIFEVIDEEATEARREGFRQIAAWLSDNNKEDLPVVLTGGFNMSPADEGFASLNTLGYKDARVEADKKDDIRSYHGWGRKAVQLDYILYKGFRLCPVFQTVTKKYPDEAGEPHFVSDHYPILTTLIF